MDCVQDEIDVPLGHGVNVGFHNVLDLLDRSRVQHDLLRWRRDVTGLWLDSWLGFRGNGGGCPRQGRGSTREVLALQKRGGEKSQRDT